MDDRRQPIVHHLSSGEARSNTWFAGLRRRAMTEKQPIPQAEIRRFDIFAEWNRLKARERHRMSAADARAYGLAVAKVVAARKFHSTTPDQASDIKRRARNDDVSEPWWEHLGSDD